MSQEIVTIDESQMLSKILELPEQFEKAWTTLWIKEIAIKAEEIDQVVILGMGGSGVAGALFVELYAEKLKIPVTLWQNYQLPAWVNDKTLVIALSFSGDTEETIDGVKLAIERKCPILAISSGGKLQELSSIHGFTLVKIDYQSSPRAALGWLYGSLLTAMAKLKLIDLTEPGYFQALDELKKAIAHKIFPPKAEELAVTLNNRIPVIMAYPPLSTVAKRWQTQFNENSKTFALAAALPEACHNVIVGTEFPVPEKILVLSLESKYGFSRNNARKKALQKVLEQHEVQTLPLSVQSGSPLSEQLLLIHFGDLLSFYLAGVYGVDPTPIEPIVLLKKELSKL